MAEELGKIERLEADKYKEGRKIFLVPLIFIGQEASEEIKKKYEQYWSEVEQSMKNLESKLGNIKKIYFESIFTAGPEGVKIIEKINPDVHRIVSSLQSDGAEMIATEDRETSEEAFDWERCLAIGLLSIKVRSSVHNSYMECARKRCSHIAKQIDETLKKDEIGALFIQEGHLVQFPADVQVFNIYPPSLDEIHRLARAESEKKA